MITRTKGAVADNGQCNARQTAHTEMKAAGVTCAFWRSAGDAGAWLRNEGMEPSPGDTVANEHGCLGIYAGMGPGGTLWVAWDRERTLDGGLHLLSTETETAYHTMAERLRTLADWAEARKAKPTEGEATIEWASDECAVIHDPDTGVWHVEDHEGGVVTEGHADPADAIREHGRG